MATPNNTATDLATLALAFITRLRSRLEGASDVNCRLSLDPDDLPSVSPGDVLYVVSPAPNVTFDQDEYAGGGIQNALCRTIFVVTLHGFNLAGEMGNDEQYLTGTRGLWEQYFVPVLRAMLLTASGADDGYLYHPDDPTTAITAEPIRPLDANTDRRNRRVGSFQIAFEVKFTMRIA